MARGETGLLLRAAAHKRRLASAWLLSDHPASTDGYTLTHEVHAQCRGHRDQAHTQPGAETQLSSDHQPPRCAHQATRQAYRAALPRRQPRRGAESSRVCWGLCFLPEPPSWLLEKDLHLTEPSRVCLALVTQCGKTGEEALSKYARHFYPISYRNFRERKKGKKHLHWHNPTTVTQGARRFTCVSSEQCLGS